MLPLLIHAPARLAAAVPCLVVEHALVPLMIFVDVSRLPSDAIPQTLGVFGVAGFDQTDNDGDDDLGLWD